MKPKKYWTDDLNLKDVLVGHKDKNAIIQKCYPDKPNLICFIEVTPQDEVKNKLVNYLKTLYGYLDKSKIRQSKSAIIALEEIEKLIGIS